MSTSGEGLGIMREGTEAGLDRYYDSMFRDREVIFPQALQLDFWREHFIVQACRESEILGGHVVDLACGTGEVDVLMVEQLPAVTGVTGLDISDLGLSYARRHRAGMRPEDAHRVQFHKADISATGLPAGCADAVLLSHTLEHLPNPAPVLREMGRLLTKDGLALVVVPNGHHHDDPDHKRHLDAAGYLRLLRRYGEVIRSWSSQEGDQLAFVFRPAARARLVTMLRVRNERDHVGPLLDHLAGWVDAVVVLDDGSVDDTADLCDQHHLVTTVTRQPAVSTDEVRDKNLLLELALDAGADWVIALDADERIEPGGQALLRTLVDSAPPWVDCLSLDCLHLWDSPLQARLDGAYGRDVRHPRLFRSEAVRELGATFAATGHGGGLHCGSVPAELRDAAVPTPVRFLHLGYLDEGVRRRKSGFYERLDPDHFAAGAYAHILAEATLVLPVVDRRELLAEAALAWSWSGEEGVLRLPDSTEASNVVLVDGLLPDHDRRAIQQTRSGYRVQVGGAPSVWADLFVETLDQARAILPADVPARGFARESEAVHERGYDAVAELAAAVAWRTEFEGSRAGRLILGWRRLRERLRAG